MSGLSPERREELAQIIAAHGEIYDGDCGYYSGCACDWDNGTEDDNDGYEAHVADAIAPPIAGWLAAEREAGAAEVRAQVWNVLNDVIADHPMWIGGDGQPLDYSPEREARVHDFIREVSAALNGGE